MLHWEHVTARIATRPKQSSRRPGKPWRHGRRSSSRRPTRPWTSNERIPGVWLERHISKH